MIALKCKMCGGDLSVSPGASVGTCQYCGTTMTLPVTQAACRWPTSSTVPPASARR